MPKPHCPITPLADLCVIEPLDDPDTTAGGILIPDVAKKRSQRGRVLRVGPGRYSDRIDRRITMDVKIGDVVLYGVYSGNEIELEGTDYKLLRADDLLGILEK